LFFFSSRRRHTSFSRDWSSDVCSSDLHPAQYIEAPLEMGGQAPVFDTHDEFIQTPPPGPLMRQQPEPAPAFPDVEMAVPTQSARSEERRVGTERSGWGPQPPTNAENAD